MNKLKSISIKQKANYPEQVKESSAQELAILRISNQKVGTNDYRHYRVPMHATVDIRYQAIDKKSMLRFVFQLDHQNLLIQYFTWKEDKQVYVDTPIDDKLTQSHAFQHILQSINFTGENHFSYLVN